MRYLQYPIFIFLALYSTSCSDKTPCPDSIPLDQMSLIPLPLKIEVDSTTFCVDGEVAISFGNTTLPPSNLLNHLKEVLSQKSALNVRLLDEKQGSSIPSIKLLVDSKGSMGYALDIMDGSITIKGKTEEDVFHGIQTFRQIVAQDTSGHSKLVLGTGRIKDAAEYIHRGSMLDVSRHFFTVEEVKRYIDLLSHYKMNVLHLHLADDQGWRIEIKKWPLLTEIGGRTEVGGSDGGFYTQKDYKEIVDYASDRYVTIIPEIDMPGHTNAALASYAELNCDGQKRELYTGMRVGFSTLCTNKPIVDTFVNDVIKELAAMTPGPYIHIGGDESDATKPADYKRFINRVQEIVNAQGKQMIGWDDIAASNLNTTSIGQHWEKASNAIKGVEEQGIKLVMSPAKKAYLDMQYDSTTKYGLHWAAYIEVDDAYRWKLENYIEGVRKEDILGVEAPLWSETVENISEVEFMAFPRILGYAEMGWTPSEKRNWEEYKYRLADHESQLITKGINYYRSPKVPWVDLKK